MTMESKTKNLIVRLSMWENEVQDYLSVGTLIYCNDHRQQIGLVGFCYDRIYVQEGWPAIDPAHLDPQVNEGRFAGNHGNGRLPPYFAAFLPGEFGQQLLSEVDHRWEALSEAEQLYVMTLAHGDFGAPQLNPQHDQHNEPIRSITELNHLVQAIREFQSGKRSIPITRELQGALCSLRGPKPKVDFERAEDGIARRYVAKLNTTGYYNDARVTITMGDLERGAGIHTCDNHVVPLECGEEVLFSHNYARTQTFGRHPDGEKYRLILKYNRVSFKTLLAEDPILNNTQRPTYKHIVYAINKYSADPVTDKEELFRRAVFTAATNHTANGLDNLEMYDQGRGRWRLSPSFHNLPNPFRDTEFDISFSAPMITGHLLRLNESFLSTLGTQFGIDPLRAQALALPVVESLESLESMMEKHNLSASDRDTLRECVNIEQIQQLHQRLSDNQLVAQQAAQIKFPEPLHQVPEARPPSRRPGM